MIFSPQKWFCSCCGKEMFSPFVHAMGRKYKVCTYECLEEMHWRETLCILGKEYYPQPPKNKALGRIVIDEEEAKPEGEDSTSEETPRKDAG